MWTRQNTTLFWKETLELCYVIFSLALCSSLIYSNSKLCTGKKQPVVLNIFSVLTACSTKERNKGFCRLFHCSLKEKETKVDRYRISEDTTGWTGLASWQQHYFHVRPIDRCCTWTMSLSLCLQVGTGGTNTLVWSWWASFTPLLFHFVTPSESILFLWQSAESWPKRISWNSRAAGSNEQLHWGSASHLELGAHQCVLLWDRLGELGSSAFFLGHIIWVSLWNKCWTTATPSDLLQADIGFSQILTWAG